ncbi:MAG: glutathione S-transferase N-terminal domain-containing protein [Parasphingorhabdus sp.]
MIDLYTWATPNGRKISIALEEMQLPYTVYPVDLQQAEQFESEFLELSPNNKIPAIVDRNNDARVFESGAILTYLAEKSGRFLPTIQPNRAKILAWLNWQVAGFGPMLGQFNHFLNVADEKLPYAIGRFSEEALRLFAILDRQLESHEYVAGEYSIADMAIYPWSLPAFAQISEQAERTFHNVERWHGAMAERPAVQAGMEVPQA